MRFVDLKIRTKLMGAFGVLIFIGFVLSVNSVGTLLFFKRDIKSFSEEFIPQLELSSNLSAHTQLVAFYMEEYSLTGKINYFKLARTALDSLKEVLAEGELLLENSPNLSTLEQNLSEARIEIPKYEQNLVMAFKTTQDINILKNRIDRNSSVFENGCRLLLQTQNQSLKNEIANRQSTDLRLKKIRSVTTIIDTAQVIDSDIFKALSLRDNSGINESSHNFSVINSEIKFLKSSLTQRGHQEIIHQVEKASGDYQMAIMQLISKLNELQEYRSTNSVISDKLVRSSANLRNTSVHYTVALAEGFLRSIRNSIVSKLIIVLISLSFSVYTGIYISRIITKPLLKGIEFAQKMAKGDLTAEIEINQKDEIGILAENLTAMSIKIREMITYISTTAENLAAASLELSSTSQLVSQGASEQASSGEEVSAAIEEMAANIQQNSENARQTEKIAVSAESAILKGSSKVNETVDAMNEIARKITIVGDIAFQTNILALNAAVEAARAGEHGRGFGVVASEVGKLAERSKIAASEIDQLTKSSVFSAEGAGKLMTEIVPEIQKTSELIQEISAANIEQSAGANQINQAIQQLNIVTQQNAATSEELATNAAELLAQAEQLQDIISFFKIDEFEHIRRQYAETAAQQVIDDNASSVVRQGVVIDLDQPYSSDDDFERF
ncbi:MAG: methyl-accepting chemotaxis protein [Prolixibacteraceae bacterium]|jgi:methyl-accepting chemotaxis protein